MKKLDWYIIKNFLVTFFYSIFLFTVIAVVIDISEKTDDFVRSGLNAAQIALQYYLVFVPHIIALLFPLFVFIAVIFFTSKLAGRSEMIAMLASGISYQRIMLPYFIGGVLLAILLVFANAYVIPRAEVQRLLFTVTYLDNNPNETRLTNAQQNVYFRIDSFTYAGIINYDTSTRRGGPFFMNTIKNNQMVYNLRANTMQWDTATKKWRLDGVYERTINGLKEKTKTDTKRQMNFNFKPFDLNSDEYTKDKLTTPELNRFINLQQQRGAEGINELKIESQRRIATPVAVILLTIIGAMVAGRKVRGGSGVHLAFGFCTAAVFIIMDRFSTIFSTKGNLPPMIAAWIPNLIFVFVAWYIYKKAPK